ncbi:MAG: VWA domain-containing protein [Veillonella sp.]|uniref:VWA domain-containing protein n=1 Tax=Veillonella sp. TaxID=1926307 RepID=UPI001ECC36DE|nr:VWA domain-containing protein [Veillonella sp.]MBS5270684.1 VWA domain-containing protein [Veillonella sp.]
MAATVERALAMALIQPKINSLIISGPTGVGKSYRARKLLQEWNIPYRTIPVHIQAESLTDHIDLEQTIRVGHYVAGKGLFNQSVKVFFIDDFHLIRESLRHLLLQRIREMGGTLIGTVNTAEGSLTISEWETIDLHVAMENPGEAKRLAVLRDILNSEYTESMMSVADFRNAETLISEIVPSEAILQLCISYIVKSGAVGNTNEFLLAVAAAAVAGLDQKSYILPKHVEEATLYVLPHRMQQQTETDNQQYQSSDRDNNQSENNTDNDMRSDEENTSDNNSQEPKQNSDTESNQNVEAAENDETKDNQDNQSQFDSSGDLDSSNELFENERQVDFDNPDDSLESNGINNIWPELIAAMNQNLMGLRLEANETMDRKARKGSGKRLRTKAGDCGGHYVRAIQHPEPLKDLALDATIRAAAPYQKLRRSELQNNSSLAIQIKQPDYRRKEREKQVGGHYLFVVDASGSMAARKRMEAVKGAIFSLLQDAYEKRDKVGLIVFRKEKAELVLPFTGSIELARRLLEHLPTGGKTPLAGALELAYRTCEQVLRRSPTEKNNILIVTDGRATYGETDNPVNEALAWAKAFVDLPVGTLILDTEQDFIRLGIAKELMQAMRGTYYSIDTVTADTVLQVVKGNRL